MYELNKRYLENKKRSTIFKQKYNTVIKFLEEAKRTPYNLKYYDWNNVNKVKNAIKALKKIDAHPSIIKSLERNVKKSENTMKRYIDNKRKNIAARKIQRAYRSIFRIQPPIRLWNYALVNPMARRIISRRLELI